MHYYQVNNPYTSISVIEKSKFIALLYSINNQTEIKSILESIKKEHPKANHHCYAYIVLDTHNNLVMNQSDDGEPSKTAGMPMLEQLKHANLVNTLAVVVRYFGGTLLGTGGLIRAYSGVVKNAILEADLITLELFKGYNITMAYSHFKTFEYLANKFGAKIFNIEYQHSITLNLYTHDANLIDLIIAIDREAIRIIELPARWL